MMVVSPRLYSTALGEAGAIPSAGSTAVRIAGGGAVGGSGTQAERTAGENSKGDKAFARRMQCIGVLRQDCRPCQVMRQHHRRMIWQVQLI